MGSSVLLCPQMWEADMKHPAGLRRNNTGFPVLLEVRPVEARRPRRLKVGDLVASKVVEENVQLLREPETGKLTIREHINGNPDFLRRRKPPASGLSQLPSHCHCWVHGGS